MTDHSLVERIIAHVQQALRDYGIPEETIVNDPEISLSTREAFDDALSRTPGGEPRGCPTPGACSCLEARTPGGEGVEAMLKIVDEERSHFTTRAVRAETRLAVAEKALKDADEWLVATLNMVEGDGIPPNWDGIRAFRKELADLTPETKP